MFGTINRKSKKKDEKGKGVGKKSSKQKSQQENEELSDDEIQEQEAELRLLDEIDDEVGIEEVHEETEIMADLQLSNGSCPKYVSVEVKHMI